jgi:hypothetical protein
MTSQAIKFATRTVGTIGQPSKRNKIRDFACPSFAVFRNPGPNATYGCITAGHPSTIFTPASKGLADRRGSAIERVGYDGLSKRVLAASLLQLGLNLLQHLGGLLEGGIELGRLAVVGHGAVLVAGGEP